MPAPPGRHATAFRRLIALILHLCTAKWAPRHPVPGQETGVKVRQPTEDDVITKSRLEPEHRSCLVPDLEFATSTPRGPAAHGPGRGRQRRAPPGQLRGQAEAASQPRSPAPSQCQTTAGLIIIIKLILITEVFNLVFSILQNLFNEHVRLL